jgi:hypothetical protein
MSAAALHAMPYLHQRTIRDGPRNPKNQTPPVREELGDFQIYEPHIHTNVWHSQGNYSAGAFFMQAKGPLLPLNSLLKLRCAALDLLYQGLRLRGRR